MKLGSTGKVMLLGMVLTAASARVLLAGIRPAPLWAQLLHATEPRPAYEVATIKRVDPMGSTGGIRASFRGTAKGLVESAYGVPFRADERVLGGPDWINRDFFIIQGKIPDDLSARMQTMTGIERVTQTRLMNQSFLADRFKLRMHFETRELPVYELVVAKGGPKLKPEEVIAAHSPAAGFTLGGREMKMTSKSETLEQLAGSLGGLSDELTGRTIVNKTGLDGRYSIALSWGNQHAPPASAADSATAGNAGPSIFTALQDQLGLKLVPGKGMVEVVVIDSIEMPTEN